MGRFVMIKCSCGFVCNRYLMGVTMGYPEVQKHQAALIRFGKYGKAWKDLMISDPQLIVDAEWALYQCPFCYQVQNEYCLDLYKSVHNDESYYYTPIPDEVVFSYKHLCQNCGKKMEQISFDRSREEEQPVICPKCGKAAIARFCGFID